MKEASLERGGEADSSPAKYLALSRSSWFTGNLERTAEQCAWPWASPSPRWKAGAANPVSRPDTVAHRLEPAWASRDKCGTLEGNRTVFRNRRRELSRRHELLDPWPSRAVCARARVSVLSTFRMGRAVLGAPEVSGRSLASVPAQVALRGRCLGGKVSELGVPSPAVPRSHAAPLHQLT